MSAPIITNKALGKMREFGLSEAQVIDVFSNGTVEKWSNGEGWNAVKKYQGYEVGVAYFVDERKMYKITTIWKRVRR